MKASGCDLREIGSRMRVAREALGVSQKQIAEENGYSVRTYQKNETGLNEAGICIARAFVRAGVNANWLLTGEGPMLLSGLMERPASAVREAIQREEAELQDRQQLTALRRRQAIVGFDDTPRSQPSSAEENLGLLDQAMEAVDEFLQEENFEASPEERRKLTRLLYAHALTTKGRPDKSVMQRFLRLIS